MSNYIPKEKLTAYERWELAAFDEAKTAAAVAQQKAAAAKIDPTPLPTPVEAPVPTPPACSEEELAAIRAEAHDAGHASGYQDGFKSGHSSGYADGQEKVAAEASRIGVLGADFAASIDGMEAALAEELLALAVDIAQQVLRGALKIKPELVLITVREAMSALANPHGHPTLVLNPEDASLVRSQLSEQLAHTGWRIIEDATLQRGGCKVESGGSEVNAEIDQRWRRVIDQIGIQTDWLGD